MTKLKGGNKSKHQNSTKQTELKDPKKNKSTSSICTLKNPIKANL